MFKKNKVKILLLAIILASFGLMIFSSLADSVTNDEKVHISAGYLHVWEGNYSFNTEHPPLLNDLAGLFAKIAKPNLPNIGTNQWDFADLFFYSSGNNVDKIVFWARLPFIFLTLGLIYLVFLWAKTLFGAKAGLVAATLTAFSPNILAHGRLATTDIGVTFFFILTLWMLRKYYFRPNWANAIFLSLSLSLVLLSKFSGIVILPIILLGFLFVFIKNKHKLSVLGHFLIVVAGVLIFIWALYIISARNELVSFNLPLVKFSQGLNSVFDHNITGHLTYLNGKLSSQGWWYYFPLVLWYKMTLSELILLVLGIILSISSVIARRLKADVAIFDRLLCFARNDDKKTRNDIKTFDYFLLFFPPLLFLGISMIGHIDIGIRHILVLLPFFYIFISHLSNSRNRYLKLALLILIGGQIIICILAFPNYIAYFNQIAGGSKGGIKHLADSNLDWDQNMKRFKKYVKANKIEKVYEDFYNGNSLTYYGINYDDVPKKPINGMVAISAQWLVVPRDRFDISWVKKYPPDEIIGSGIYIWRFDLKPVELR